MWVFSQPPKLSQLTPQQQAKDDGDHNSNDDHDDGNDNHDNNDDQNIDDTDNANDDDDDTNDDNNDQHVDNADDPHDDDDDDDDDQMTIYPKPTVRFQDEDDQKDDDDNDDDDHDDDKDPVYVLHIQAPSEDLLPNQHNQSQKKGKPIKVDQKKVLPAELPRQAKYTLRKNLKKKIPFDVRVEATLKLFLSPFLCHSYIFLCHSHICFTSFVSFIYCVNILSQSTFIYFVPVSNCV